MASLSEMIEQKFSKFHSQKLVVLKILEYGLRVEGGRVLCNDVEIELRSIARECKVDARAVKAAINNIEQDKKLSNIFKNMKSTIHLGRVAPFLGMGEIVIEPYDARDYGIIYQTVEVLWKHKVSIRQAIGDDPEFVEDPKLYIITDSPIPASIIPELKKSSKIKGVTIY
ncbi:MAG: amino acid-binding protein [Candidatus Thermoplasmatota archaeon]|nr:amino acid-binding protein [Candidatus Thermoplasmatota archaeon]MCL5789777.1 amino acid-binding protein [Candidatus Thermoplasmatota archaeon]